jgi:hypothetical protein
MYIAFESIFLDNMAAHFFEILVTFLRPHRLISVKSFYKR